MALAAAPDAPATVFANLDCHKAFDGGQPLSLCQRARGREDLWVNFKLFGLMALTVLFILVQSLWLARHVQPDDPESGESTSPPEERACSTRS